MTINLETDRNPDRGWAWVISVACGVINGLTFGLIRSFGVFFFHLRQDFNLSRETASWPFALCTCTAYLCGPITGLLVSYFPLRNIVLVGVVAASAGFLYCSFANNIVHFSIGIGIAYGFGVGLSFMQTPVILAQYFNKYLATANSISQAGGTVGSFIFTPLLEYFISLYGIQGAFLITSAILLNGIPCGMLLRPPQPSVPDEDEADEGSRPQLERQDSSGGFRRQSYSKLLLYRHRRKSKEGIFLRKSSLDVVILHDCKSQNWNMKHFRDINPSQTLLLKEMLTEENLQTHQKKIRLLSKLYKETKSYLIEACNDPTPDVIDDIGDAHYFLAEEGSSETPTTFQTRYVQTLPFNKPQIWFDSILFIVQNPMYLILLTTHVSFQWTWMTYQMIIYDYAMDQNLTRSQSVSLLTFFAISDLFGRFLSGWIADKGLMKKNHIVSICILCIGFIIQFTAHHVTFHAQLILANFLGFFCGVIIVLFNILAMEYVGLNHFPDALGLTAFFVGISSFARPYVIGTFRDVFGSYWGLFQFAGVISFVSALLWLVEPFAILSHKRTQTRHGFQN